MFILDSLFITHNKGRRPVQFTKPPLNWTISQKAYFPECSENEILKYFVGEDDISVPIFRIRLSDYKYDKYLFTINEDKLRPEYFASFCLDVGINSTSNQLTGTIAVACQSSLNEQCRESVCIRSCCPPNHFYLWTSKKCVRVEKTKQQLNEYKLSYDILINSNSSGSKTQSENTSRRRLILYGPPKCDSNFKSKYITLNFSGYHNEISGRVPRDIILIDRFK